MKLKEERSSNCVQSYKRFQYCQLSPASSKEGVSVADETEEESGKEKGEKQGKGQRTVVRIVVRLCHNSLKMPLPRRYLLDPSRLHVLHRRRHARRLLRLLDSLLEAPITFLPRYDKRCFGLALEICVVRRDEGKEEGEHGDELRGTTGGCGGRGRVGRSGRGGG